MPVIAAVNLKGGVGKTSCCMHLGGALAQLGQRVLLVDNDPQSSLTAGFMGLHAARALDPAGTIAAIHAGEDPFPEAVIRTTGFERIDLLPGSRFAAASNVPEPHKAPFDAQVRLRDFLIQVLSAYDLILVDCPPNLHLCSWAAMAAADALLVPLQLEDFGSQGTIDVGESAAMVRSVINSQLALLGYVVSMFQARRTVHQAFLETFREAHGDAVFGSVIPEAAEYAEAVTKRTPVVYYKPRGIAARAIKALAEEVLARLTASDAGAGEAA